MPAALVEVVIFSPRFRINLVRFVWLTCYYYSNAYSPE